MAAKDIQKKIKRGLSKAINKTGSSDSDLVYVEKTIVTGGDGTPLNTGTTSVQNVLLVDAIFKSYNKKYFGETIKAGDRQLVSNNDVVINIDDIIVQGNERFKVIDVEIKAPTSDVVCYICQVRKQ